MLSQFSFDEGIDRMAIGAWRFHHTKWLEGPVLLISRMQGATSSQACGEGQDKVTVKPHQDSRKDTGGAELVNTSAQPVSACAAHGQGCARLKPGGTDPAKGTGSGDFGRRKPVAVVTPEDLLVRTLVIDKAMFHAIPAQILPGETRSLYREEGRFRDP